VPPSIERGFYFIELFRSKRPSVCATISFLGPGLRHLLFRRLLFGVRDAVSVKRKADKSKYYEEGSGYDHPVRIFHRGEHPLPGSQTAATMASLAWQDAQ
jgi:hypothetical protein